MSSLLGRVLGAVGSFSGLRKAADPAPSDTAGPTDVMASAEETAPMPGKNAKKRLFDDDEDAEDLDVGAHKESSFTINEEYARRFEHNKKREEKQKLEEKYGKGATNEDDEDEDSSDDEDEDEAGYLLTEDLDARMTAALEAIKNKDPRIYDSETKFFDPAEIDQVAQEVAKGTAEPKEKPMFLRDYHRERYLRGDVGAEDDDDDEAVPKTYQQEQDEVKQALIDEMNALGEDDEKDDDKMDEDDIDTFIKPKASSKAVKEAAAASGIHPSRVGHMPKITEADVANADKNPELFLSNFLASRAWVPEDEKDGPGWRAFESDDDESENDRAEEFEAAYNMRFEDPTKSNEVLKSYSRSVVAERSVRREDKTARQRQREQEKEREAAGKRERKEERARLRKLRVEEAQEKLDKIRQAAGIQGKEIHEDEWTELLDEDTWDTDKWEAKMLKQFGDVYYSQPDADLAGEKDEDSDSDETTKRSKLAKKAKKPKWDDDIDINDIVPEFDDAVPEVSLTDAEESGEAAEEIAKEDEEDEEDADQPAKRRKTNKDHKQERAEAKRKARRERARIEAIVDRHLELDAPEALAASGSSSGFRYRETSPQSFGLTARDILLAPSDAVLNEFAGLKKLATFRDEERKRKDRKKLGKKARLRQWRRETFGAEFEKTGPTYGFERVIGESNNSQHHGHHHEHHAKRKGKAAKEADDGEKAGKKRKRAGRKGKDSEKSKTAE